MAVGLVLAAGGSGSRFAATGLPKQFRPLAGRPLFLWSLAAFRGQVGAAVIVSPAPLQALVQDLVGCERHPFPVTVVAGGDSRLGSVGRGLMALGDACDRVLVHDAARPLVGPEPITACIRALDAVPAAVVAIPCAHTVKRVADGQVAETVPRDDLWLAQTPQGLHRALATAAFAQAEAEGWHCSDDVSVMERAGHAVSVVPGQATNLKVTTADDWPLAEAILAAREGFHGGVV